MSRRLSWENFLDAHARSHSALVQTLRRKKQFALDKLAVLTQPSVWLLVWNYLSLQSPGNIHVFNCSTGISVESSICSEKWLCEGSLSEFSNHQLKALFLG